MLAVVLALLSAITFGASDYAAGLAARSASVFQIALAAQATSLVVSLLIVPWVSPFRLPAAAAAWGAGAGLAGVAGAVALYLGFRHAAFSVASTLSAVGSAALSVLAGLLYGERPSGLALTGIALALPAIAAVSASPAGPATGPAPEPAAGPTAEPAAGPAAEPAAGPPAGPATGPAPEPATGPAPEPAAGPAPEPAAGPTAEPAAGPTAEPAAEPAEPAGGLRAVRAASGRHLLGVGYGLTAGCGFALYFIGLNRAGSGSGLWPIVVGEVVSVPVLAAVAAATGQFGWPAPGSRSLSVVTGVAGTAGAMLYFVATHRGLLAVTAVVTSLYPAGTILLARVRLGERLSVMRVAGLALAGASVALIAVAGAG